MSRGPLIPDGGERAARDASLLAVAVLVLGGWAALIAVVGVNLAAGAL